MSFHRFMRALWDRLAAIVETALLAWRHRADVKTLRQEIALLTVARGPASNAATFWNTTAEQICRRIATESPCTFLRWPEICHTMFVHDAEYSAPQAARLHAAPDWESRWRPALREHSLGRPLPSRHGRGTSDNALHMASHLLEFENQTGARLDGFDAIVELGGGYGCFCRTARQIGFRGPYLILDLPHQSALQRFYLGGLGIPAAAYSEAPRAGLVQTVNGAEQAQAAIKLLSPEARVLFVATWSFSECPLSFRESVLPIIRRCDALLLAYQSTFEGIDNAGYFAAFESDLSGLFEWRRSTRNLPAQNQYLFGIRAPVPVRE